MLHRRKEGFTLLELIIVVIVIGILASVALPRYIRVAEKGRTVEAKNILGSLRTAELRYAAQYNAYTVDPTVLDVDVTSSKYFSFNLPTGVAVSNPPDDTVIIATATRTATETSDPGWTVTITAGGTLSTDAAHSTLL